MDGFGGHIAAGVSTADDEDTAAADLVRRLVIARVQGLAFERAWVSRIGIERHALQAGRDHHQLVDACSTPLPAVSRHPLPSRARRATGALKRAAS